MGEIKGIDRTRVNPQQDIQLGKPPQKYVVKIQNIPLQHWTWIQLNWF